jgi:cytoskeletal protein RodZ
MAQNDRLTHDYFDDSRSVRRDEWSSGATIAYVVIALLVVGFIYLVTAAYWSSPETTLPPATAPVTDTTGQTAPPPLTTAPAPTEAPAPAPAPEAVPAEPSPAPSP